MRMILLSVIVVITFAQRSWAIYGPSLERTDPAIAMRACQEAGFSQSQEIGRAMRSKNPVEIEIVLAVALREWRTTDRSLSSYPAKAFCIHELVPANLPAVRVSTGSYSLEPTQEVKRFQFLGIVYRFYDPDGAWILRDNPVDLKELAAKYPKSIWGREAFLMMTRLGWSQGSCQEGPDQFRAVISHGEEFLRSFPDTEISVEMHLELAKAYTTWWNLSRAIPADDYTDPAKYKLGAEEARRKAIKHYQAYLKDQKAQPLKVQKALNALEQQRQDAPTYDYYCPDYED
jgi:hypothetical protein